MSPQCVDVLAWIGTYGSITAADAVKIGIYRLENIINMINAGGYVCGVGEWRPEKSGQNGMFHVE